jgi:WD40 repeat protein
LATLALADRNAVEAWLLEFDQGWHEGLLAIAARNLPLDHALRRAALVEMVKIDLERQWRLGLQIALETYLQLYPELGLTDDLPADLIAAEYVVRRQAGMPAGFTDLAQRFPRQAALVRQHLQQNDITLSGDAPAARIQSPDTTVEPTHFGIREEAMKRRSHSLGPPPLNQTQAATSGPTVPVENIGSVVASRVKLLERLGEGGMGTVWVAEQLQPVRRKIALKVIKEGMNSKAVLARFDAERQALALMDHPNIAKVLDGGTTANGRPFFVMEYVKGVPLTKYCDDARLSIAQRLELFVPVCQAVQHAHQKGIIHRDLKPANILVCLYDGKALPKVIDFGLAKAMHQPLTEYTLHTAHGVVMGTLLYMSPEQAEFNNLDVDTRTDIYSLGVILYELLTGTTPLGQKRFQDAAWQEMLRLIKEEEPAKPSAYLNSSDTLPTIAARRQTEPVKLTRLVRGELDWIALKALEKERSRRYETANGFARDVERYLADEPVEALPPSASYRLRKFMRRHRGAILTVATFVLLLVAGAAVSTWQAIRATVAEAEAKDQETIAKQNERAAIAQQKETAKQKIEADRQAKIAQDNEKRANEAVADLKYLNRILLAQAAFTSGNVYTAWERLLEVPPNQRRWEWHYLNRQYRGGIFTMYGHGAVTSVAFSPDGTRLATASVDKTAKVWDARTGTLLFELKGHLGGVSSVAFSTDNTRLATASVDKTAKVWDAHTGILLFELKGHQGDLSSVAFSPDGTRLATASVDKTARISDARDGMFLFELTGHKEKVTGVAFSPDGLHLVSGSEDKTARVWDARTGKLLVEFRGHNGGVSAVAFSPDGTRLVTGSEDKTAKVWDVHARRPVVELKGHTEGVTTVAFSPDGTRLATGSLDTKVKVWDARAGTLVLDLKGHFLTVMSVTFSPDGTRLLTGSVDETAKVWDSRAGVPVVELKSHSDQVTSVAFSPDGTRVATVSGFLISGAQVWDARTGTALLSLKGRVVSSVAFSPDGTRLLTGSRDSTAQLWDAGTGTLFFELRQIGGVSSVAFSPDGTRLATASVDKTPNVWDARTGLHLFELQGHTNVVSCLTFSPDGTRLATGSWDNTARIWDVRVGTLLFELKGHDGKLTSVAFSPDGTRLATSNEDNRVTIWDAGSGAALVEVTDFVTSVAFSPDGARLATGSWDNTARIWDAHSGTLLLELKGHTDSVTSVAFSVDGSRLVTGSKDRTVKIWDAHAGTPMLKLKTRGGRMTSVAFSANGQRVITRAKGGPERIWDTKTGQELKEDPRPAMPPSRTSPDGRYFAHLEGDHILIVDRVLSPEEREYRLLATRPRPDVHLEEHAKALTAKNAFAASFHLERLCLALDVKDPRVATDVGGQFQLSPLVAARLFADLFTAQPKLADDLDLQLRYKAACYAARAGSGKGTDAEKLNNNERARWRKQALDWLRADLGKYVKTLETGEASARQLVSRRLNNWKYVADLAGIRDEKALADMSAAEQEACQKLWVDVEVLLKKAMARETSPTTLGAACSSSFALGS